MPPSMRRTSVTRLEPTWPQVRTSAAFNGLRQELNSYRTNQDQNWDVTKANNTYAFLAKLNACETPEAVTAVQQDG